MVWERIFDSVCLNRSIVYLVKIRNGDGGLCVLCCVCELCRDTILCFDRRGCPLIKNGSGDGQNHPVKLHGVGEQSAARDPRGLRKSEETRGPRYVRFVAA